MLDTTAQVEVEEPGSTPDGGWTKYQVQACINGGGCGDTQDCSPLSTTGPTICTVASLSPNTAYTVKVAAVAGSIISLTGTDVTLTTRISCVCCSSWLPGGRV